MRKEILRQLVHLSGLVFISLAWFMDKVLVGILFMLAALFFLLYSEYVSKCGKDHKTMLSRIECKLREERSKAAFRRRFLVLFRGRPGFPYIPVKHSLCCGSHFSGFGFPFHDYR
jgi:dolichol kinase